MKRILLGLVFICIVAIGYATWPVFSMYQIYSSAQSKDKATLEKKVDWPSVRRSFHESIEKFVKKEVKKQSDIYMESSAGVLAIEATSELSQLIITEILITYMTPDGFIKLVESGGKIDIGEFGIADKLRMVVEKKSKVMDLAFDAKKLKESPTKALPGVGLLTSALGASKTEEKSQEKKEEPSQPKEKIVKKEKPKEGTASHSGSEIQLGMDNIKFYGILGFTNYNEYKFGVSKDPNAKEPDLIAVMALEGFDWKLRQVIPRLK